MLRALTFAVMLLATTCVEAAAPRAFYPTGRVDALAAADAPRAVHTTRPIFAPAAPIPARPTSIGMLRPTATPAHRRASFAADPESNAALSAPGTGSVPTHRRALGW